MSKFINPFTDFGFKKLFGEEASKEILISFLNEILASETGVITDLTYMNTELLPDSATMRKSFFDIFCKNERGDQFIVELQRAEHKHFMDRLIYYSTFPIQQEAIKGEWNFQISALYVIAILDFEIKDEPSFTKDLLTYVQLMNRKTCEVIYKKLLYVFVSMKQFKKSESELNSFFDRWLYVLRNMDKFERYPDHIKEKILMKFLNRAEIAMLDDRERAIYEYSLKVYRDEMLVKMTRDEQDRKREEEDRIRAEADRRRIEEDKIREEKDKIRAEQDLERAKHESILKEKQQALISKEAEIEIRQHEVLQKQKLLMEKEHHLKQIIEKIQHQGLNGEQLSHLFDEPKD